MRQSALLVVLLAMGSAAVSAQVAVPGGPNQPRPPAGGVTGPRAPGMPPRDASSQPSGTAILRGRVVRADTGQPLRRVQVRAMAPELREGRSVMTDEEGRYELKQLPAGRINLMASKGGYVTLQYGQRRPLQAGQPIEVSEGQVIEKLDFALPRGGVIIGQVLDEFGDPITGAFVQALRYQFFNGQRRLMPTGGAATDDRGDFRLFGVAPGDYYVTATLRNGFMPGVSDDRLGYAPTYYPGTPVSSEAQRITVAVGQEVPGIVIQLVAARTMTISGIARDGDGRPLANAPVMVMQKADDGGVAFGAMSGGSTTRADGTFTVGNVAPGSYTLQARSNGNPAENATVDVVVSGGDITGVVLTVTRGATARGRIRFDSGTRPSDLRPGDVRIFPASPEPGPLFGGGPGTVKEDWTFEVTGLSGRRLLRFNTPPAWAVKNVTVDGADITDATIDFKGDDVDGIEVVLTQRISEVSGSVTNSSGAKITDATVIVFADDRERWTPMTRFVRSARPDQDGRFKVRGLPPGRYVAVALDYIEPGEESNPETLEQLRSRGTSLTLRDGETHALDLKVSAGL
jgi:hypothetical protein